MAKQKDLQLYRGTEANRTGVTPLAGEPIWTTDTGYEGRRVWVGDGSKAGGWLVGPDGGYMPGHKSGYWYLPSNMDEAPAGGTSTVNFIAWAPLALWGRELVSVDGLGVNVTGAGGGAETCRLALYSSSNGEPDALLAESTAIDVTSTGFKSHAIALSLVPAFYWVAFQTDSATATFSRQGATGATPLLGFNNGGTVARCNIFFRARAYAAFPDPAGATGAASAAVPAVFLKKA